MSTNVREFPHQLSDVSSRVAVSSPHKTLAPPQYTLVDELVGFPKYPYKDHSLSDISRGTGLHLSTVSRIFSGERNLGMKAATQIANYLGIGIDQLIKIRREFIEEQKDNG